MNFEISLTCSRNPRFAILRWKYQEFCMAVAVRPSPPYRDWVEGNSKPLTWMEAVTHENVKLERLCRLHLPCFAKSPNSPPVNAPGPSLPLLPATQDFECQFIDSCRSVSCQSSIELRDFAIGPDLIHLETTLTLYRPFWFYRPLCRFKDWMLWVNTE